MNQRRLIHKLSAITLIISLTLSCSFITSLTGTSNPYQEVIGTALSDSQSGNMQAADQSEQDMTNVLREQSGARAAFGDQADEIFQQIDQAKALTIQALVKQQMGQSVTAPRVSQNMSLISLSTITKESPLVTTDNQLATWAGSLGLMIATPFLLESAPRDENGNAIIPKIETENTKDQVTVHISMQPKLMGSKMESDVEMIVSIKEPFAYEERTTGKMSMDLCPDAQGNVPLQYSLHSGMALKGGGQQLESDGQATGHVSDEGQLANFDLHLTTSAARQPFQGAGDDWGTANKYFEYKMDLTGTSLKNPKDGQANGDVTRSSSDADWKYFKNVMPALMGMNGAVVGIAFTLAETQWTDGYCVEVQVPELGAGKQKNVQPNSETPFTAIVRHKFEKVELNVPVIATLKDGQVSVNPSGSKVPAPATFTYKAPDKSGQTATVNLETRSRRGIAKLDVTFTTGQGWKVVDPGIGGSTLSGVVCDLAKPFTITNDFPGRVPAHWEYQFAPSSADAGELTLDAIGTLKSTTFHWIGHGAYTVAGAGTDAVKISSTVTSTVIVTGGGDTVTKSDTAPFNVDLVPLDTNECGQP